MKASIWTILIPAIFFYSFSDGAADQGRWVFLGLVLGNIMYNQAVIYDNLNRHHEAMLTKNMDVKMRLGGP